MKQHVLVVDDCEDVRFLLSLKLRKLGYEVIEATDGNDALEVLEDNDEIEILLIDIMMPDISGFELIKRIKDQHQVLKKNIKIIFVTASKEKNIETRAKSLGADGVISKPIKDKLLNQQLKHILDN